MSIDVHHQLPIAPKFVICRGNDTILKPQLVADFKKLSINPPDHYSFHFQIGIASIILASMSSTNHHMQVIYDPQGNLPIGYVHLVEDYKVRKADISLIEVFEPKQGYGSFLLTQLKEQDFQALTATVYRKPNPELFPLKVSFYEQNDFKPVEIGSAFTKFIWTRSSSASK